MCCASRASKVGEEPALCARERLEAALQAEGAKSCQRRCRESCFFCEEADEGDAVDEAEKAAISGSRSQLFADAAFTA